MGDKSISSLGDIMKDKVKYEEIRIILGYDEDPLTGERFCNYYIVWDNGHIYSYAYGEHLSVYKEDVEKVLKILEEAKKRIKQHYKKEGLLK